jgi:thymidylate kinase
VDLLPRPDLLIYPRAPRDVCERRIYARGLWERFQNKTRDETSRFMAQAETAVALAARRARERGWTVIEVDNGQDDPAPARAALRSALSAIAPETRPEPIDLAQSVW